MDEGRGERWYHCSVLLVSQSWSQPLHSVSCRVKGFALTLGSSERDFLKLLLFLQVQFFCHNSKQSQQIATRVYLVPAQKSRSKAQTKFQDLNPADLNHCSLLFKSFGDLGLAFHWLKCDRRGWIFIRSNHRTTTLCLRMLETIIYLNVCVHINFSPMSLFCSYGDCGCAFLNQTISISGFQIFKIRYGNCLVIQCEINIMWHHL